MTTELTMNGASWVSLFDYEALQTKCAELERLSVTNIMLDVVPGEHGEGEEIYAKSVDDVVRVLTDLGTKLEDTEFKLAALKTPNAK